MERAKDNEHEQTSDWRAVRTIYLIRGFNWVILQKRRTSPVEGALLDKRAHLVDRGIREGIRSIDSILGRKSLHLPGSRQGPEITRVTAEPV